ncbi:MAG: CHAD domain-containing protein [Nitrososphaerales archaeon]
MPSKLPSLTKSAYLESLERGKKKVRYELGLYIKAQSPKTVHDLRTAIRRMDASFRVLPKSQRKKGIKKYLRQLRKLLRMNTEVRDYDLILSRIQNVDGNDPSIKTLKAGIEKEKEARLADSRKKAMKISVLYPPAVKKISQREIDRRFAGILGKLDSRISNALPEVLNDAKKVEELHEMRKDCKTLRYTLELAPKENAEAIKLLISWQDVLGSIHDSDITVKFLDKRKKSPMLEQILSEDRSKRDLEYKKFAESIGQSIPKSLLGHSP